MTLMNDNGNMKQFGLLRFINENCDDDHVISRISIVLRRDKLEAPYYMIAKIRMSTCLDRPEKGLIHAMDTMNHNRQHNLTEDAYNEIRELIIGRDHESDLVKISQEEDVLIMDLMSKDDDEFRSLFDEYHELFDKIDNLID